MTTVEHLKHISRDPIGHHGLYSRTPEALTVIEARNAAQIEADEYAESWLARHGLFVLSAAMVATFCVVVGLRFADYVHDKTRADLRLYEKFQEGK